MSEIIFNETVAPNTPATGKGTLYLDSADKLLKVKDSTGAITPLKQDTVSALLEGEPVTVGTTYSVTYASGLVSQELWKRSSDNTNLKQITYTYSSGLVQTEVRKVFAADGTTVVGQVTLTYAYTSGLLASVGETRDV